MPPTDPKPLGATFEAGLQARIDGKALHDNPYAAGSAERREWHAGFCATAEAEDEGDLALDPNEGPKRRTAG